MQARRKTRLYIVLAVLAGLGLTVSLTLYALSSNIDLFYTPGKLSTAKRKPIAATYGQRLRMAATFSRAPCSATRKPSTSL
jgi:cytochrome c-type biogenesis protein CcmE